MPYVQKIRQNYNTSKISKFNKYDDRFDFDLLEKRLGKATVAKRQPESKQELELPSRSKVSWSLGLLNRAVRDNKIAPGRKQDQEMEIETTSLKSGLSEKEVFMYHLLTWAVATD